MDAAGMRRGEIHRFSSATGKKMCSGSWLFSRNLPVLSQHLLEAGNSKFSSSFPSSVGLGSRCRKAHFPSSMQRVSWEPAETSAGAASQSTAEGNLLPSFGGKFGFFFPPSSIFPFGTPLPSPLGCPFQLNPGCGSHVGVLVTPGCLLAVTPRFVPCCLGSCCQ